MGAINVNPLVCVYDRVTRELINAFDARVLDALEFTLDMSGGCKEFSFTPLQEPQEYIEGFDIVTLALDPALPPQYVGEIITLPITNAGHYGPVDPVMIEDFEDGAADVANWNSVGASVTPPPPTPSIALSAVGPSATFKPPPMLDALGTNRLMQLGIPANFDELGDSVLIYRNLTTALDLTGRGVSAWLAVPYVAGSYWGKIQIRIYSAQGTGNEAYIGKEFAAWINARLWSAGKYDFFPLWVSLRDYDVSGGPGTFDIANIDRVAVYFERGATGAPPAAVMYLDYIQHSTAAAVLPKPLRYITNALVYTGFGFCGKCASWTYGPVTHSAVDPATIFETIAATVADIDDTASDSTGLSLVLKFLSTAVDTALCNCVQAAGNHYWLVGQNQAYSDAPRVLAEIRAVNSTPEYYWKEGQHFDRVQGRVDFSRVNTAARLRVGRVVQTGKGTYAAVVAHPQATLLFGARYGSAEVPANNDTEPLKLTAVAWGTVRTCAYPIYELDSFALQRIESIIWPGKIARIIVADGYFDAQIKSVRYSWTRNEGLTVTPEFGEISRGGPLFRQLDNVWRTLGNLREMIDRNA